jgi:hypothetical protein
MHGFELEVRDGDIPIDYNRTLNACRLSLDSELGLYLSCKCLYCRR